MTRWQPGAGERLQAAAIELFLEQGYQAVTVADIADRAGLTKRSFFNHFADKREVLFAGAKAFEIEVVRCLRGGDKGLSSFDAAVDALGRAGESLADYASYLPTRRRLIESSLELRERDLIKSVSLSAAIMLELVERGVSGRLADFAARAAVTAFAAAYDDWAESPGAKFSDLMNSAAVDTRSALHVSEAST